MYGVSARCVMRGVRLCLVYCGAALAGTLALFWSRCIALSGNDKQRRQPKLTPGPPPPPSLSFRPGTRSMLLRQHQSIDSLTEVVQTQANTISNLVLLVGGGGGGGGGGGVAEAAAAGAAAPDRRARVVPATVAPGAATTNGGADGVDDADAIAEMVAYLDDDVAAPAAAAAAVVGM